MEDSRIGLFPSRLVRGTEISFTPLSHATNYDPSFDFWCHYFAVRKTFSLNRLPMQQVKAGFRPFDKEYSWHQHCLWQKGNVKDAFPFCTRSFNLDRLQAPLSPGKFLVPWIPAVLGPGHLLHPGLLIYNLWWWYPQGLSVKPVELDVVTKKTAASSWQLWLMIRMPRVEDLMPSSGLWTHQACTWYTRMHVDEMQIK